MMDADEKEIFRYLRGEPEQFIPANFICRHAGGKHRHRVSPDWAKPVLLRMLERGILEMDSSGSYRLTPIPTGDTNTRRWVAPHLAALLRKSGRKFEGMIQFEGDLEAYYDSL